MDVTAEAVERERERDGGEGGEGRENRGVN